MFLPLVLHHDKCSLIRFTSKWYVYRTATRECTMQAKLKTNGSKNWKLYLTKTRKQCRASLDENNRMKQRSHSFRKNPQYKADYSKYNVTWANYSKYNVTTWADYSKYKVTWADYSKYNVTWAYTRMHDAHQR